MEQVYHQVTLSMILLKCVGGLIFLLGTVYLLIKRPEYLPTWRNVIVYGSMFGLLNAGPIQKGRSDFWKVQKFSILCLRSG